MLQEGWDSGFGTELLETPEWTTRAKGFGSNEFDEPAGGLLSLFWLFLLELLPDSGEQKAGDCNLAQLEYLYLVSGEKGLLRVGQPFTKSFYLKRIP